ncbi:MAG: TetR/AcrR family transcriptional regulator [Bradymonadaceae bacterium]|nr:TetR/AcrR family transcriptional regulator [Lujinxingiaceae bacterium]
MAQRQSTEERRRQIAEAALQIIAEHGIGKFTTAAIAEEVGLAEGTIFRHFSTKQDIVLAAIGLMKDRFSEGFPPEHQDPLERLGIFIRGRLELVVAHPGVFRAFFSDELAHAAGKEGEAIVMQIKQESMAFIQGCLNEAIASGQLRTGLKAEFLVRIIQGTIHAFVFGPLPVEKTWQLPSELAQHAWQTILTLIRR